MISQTRTHLPPVQPLKQSPTATRVSWESVLPKTLPRKYVDALIAAGWTFNIPTVSLQSNRGKSATLDSLKYDFQNWLAKSGEYPSASKLETLQQEVLREAMALLPKTGNLV